MRSLALALPALAGLLAGLASANELAPDPAAVVRAHRQLADLYLARKDLGMAEVAARTAVAVGEADLGADDPRTADAYATLGQILVARGNRTGATAAYGQAVASRRSFFLTAGWTAGGRARQAALLREYASLLEEADEAVKAEEMTRRAIEHERAADAEFKDSLRRELEQGKGPAGPPSAKRRVRISVAIDGRDLREYEEDTDVRRGR